MTTVTEYLNIFPGCWDPKVVPIEDLFKATILALELGMLEQRTQILGGIALFDLEDIGTQHAWQITPSVAARIVKLLVVSVTLLDLNSFTYLNIPAL